MLEKIHVRKERATIKFKLQGDDIALIDEVVEWMQSEGLEHVDRDVAVESVLQSFFDGAFRATREFKEWKETENRAEGS